jgi:hypothetical protein
MSLAQNDQRMCAEAMLLQKKRYLNNKEKNSAINA